MFNFLPKENLQYFLNQIKNKLDLKVDKVSGKTLSTNDLTNSLKTSYDDAVSKKHTHANKAVLDNTTASFTTEEKTKLSGIAAGAQVNVQSDWDETTTSAAAFIKNKPTIPSATSQLKNDSDYTTSEFVTNALKSKVDIKEGWDLSENNLTAALITKINNADAKTHTHSNYATLENIEEAYTTAEKNKLKNIAAGAQVNSITGVKGDSETEYRTGNVNITKANIGLGSVDNTTDVNKPVSTAQQKAIDAAYANSNKYTDKKIADLINGAPETMDTLKEVSDAINASKSVEEALNKAIGTKANQTELDTHTGNDTIHITATERTNWNDANSKKHSHANKTTLDGITADKVASWDKISNKIDTDGNASNTTVAFKEATTRTNLTTGEKISISFGKIAKWFNDLKTVAFSGNYNDLTNKPTIPSVGNGTVTITQNGASKGTFTMNQSGNTTIALTDTNTNTWRDVVDNLSSTRTDASLSANQGRILGAKLPFALGIDADGNYGYYKAGADTVTPFSTDFGDIILGNFATHNLGSIRNPSAIKSSFDSAIDVVMNMDTSSPQEFNMQTISCGVFFNRDKKYKYMYLCRTKQTYTSAYIRGVIVSATGYGANDIVIKTDSSATDGPITTVAKKIDISEYDYVLAYPYCGWSGSGNRYMPVVFSQNEYF